MTPSKNNFGCFDCAHWEVCHYRIFYIAHGAKALANICKYYNISVNFNESLSLFTPKKAFDYAKDSKIMSKNEENSRPVLTINKTRPSQKKFKCLMCLEKWGKVNFFGNKGFTNHLKYTHKMTLDEYKVFTKEKGPAPYLDEVNEHEYDDPTKINPYEEGKT